MGESVFLALPRKCCDPSYWALGPNPKEFVALLEGMRSCGLAVHCPLEEIGWHPGIMPGDAKQTMASRIEAIDRADHFVAFPRVGPHASSGVYLLLGIAYVLGKRVTVVLPGKDAIDVEWQLKGLAYLSQDRITNIAKEIGGSDLQIFLYTGSVVDCWPELQNRLLRMGPIADLPKKGSLRAPVNTQDAVEDRCPFKGLEHYWRMRHKLFSLWYNDAGEEQVLYDEVGLYTVKPEEIAAEIAKSIKGQRVIDFFAGIGGVAIALARAGKDVIAFEKDPRRSEMLRHNCQVYDVSDRVRCETGDAFELLKREQFDAIYLDPPWGGPSYFEKKAFKFRHFKVAESPDACELAMKALLRFLLHEGTEVAFTIPNNFDFPEFNKFYSEFLKAENLGFARDLRIRWGMQDGRALFMTLNMPTPD